MRLPMYGILFLLTLAWLAGCATGPGYQTAAAATDLVPAEVSAHPGDHRDKRVIWGGLIVATRNLDRYTEIEVLGYPLDRNQRPMTSRPPQGRYLVRMPGYLEEVDYAPGRHITVTGTLGQSLEGHVGEAAYTYPLVQAPAIHLWPRAAEGETGRTRFNIGVGVIFGR